MSGAALVLSTLAGLSTGLGGILVVLMGRAPSKRAMGHMLSFSSGVMLFISFVDLLPEAMGSIGFLWANVAFFAGMAAFALVVALVPEPAPSKDGRSQLMHMGLLTALGLSLHNFPEGAAVYLSALQGTAAGLPLALAIAAHNIPEGMAVAAPILGATRSPARALRWAFVSGLCEPAGAILLGWLFRAYLTPFVIKAALAAVAGVMTFMCFHELVPQSLAYLSPGHALWSNSAGMVFIAATVWLLQEHLGFKLK